MSAFYAMAFPDRVELLTDGAVYNEDGTLVDIKCKVYVSGHLPLAITGRGVTEVIEIFADAFLLYSNACSTFDEAISGIQWMLDRRKDRGVPHDVEVVICGISETRGPCIFYFATADMYGAGIEPWRLLDAGGELGGGASADVGADIAASGIAPEDAREGLRGVAVPLFDAMRRRKGPNPLKPGLPDVYGIGGHIDLTVVRPTGCTVERLHTWSDVVGERIEPERMAIWETRLDRVLQRGTGRNIPRRSSSSQNPAHGAPS